MPSSVLPELKAVLEPFGGPALRWAKFKDALSSEIERLWNEVDDAEEAEKRRLEQKAKEEAEAWAAMTREEKRRIRFIREKAALQAKLGTTLAKMGEEEQKVDVESETDVEFAQRMRKEHAKFLRESLELYRAAVSVLYGVSQVTLHSNKSKVEIALEGFDIFDPFP